jgi:hypothetical protein
LLRKPIAFTKPISIPLCNEKYGLSRKWWIVAITFDAVEKLVAARVASLNTRRVERFENSCIGSVRAIPL